MPSLKSSISFELIRKHAHSDLNFASKVSISVPMYGSTLSKFSSFFSSNIALLTVPILILLSLLNI